jgi:hypothetical protein
MVSKSKIHDKNRRKDDRFMKLRVSSEMKEWPERTNWWRI